MGGASIFPFPAFLSFIVSGLGKQEIASSSLPQISYLLWGVPRMVLLTSDWPILKT